MTICADFHIPHSEFLEWEPDDRAKAVAFYLEKAQKCHKCGTAQWEWDEEEGGSRFAYEAVEDLCYGCLRLEAANADLGQKQGITAILIPTNTRDYLRRQQMVEERWHAEMLARRS